MTTDGYLLDTCAVIWLSQGESIAPDTLDAVEAGELFVSPMTAWELGLLVSRGRLRISLQPLKWFDSFLDVSRASLISLSPEILVASSFLPGKVHSDPADRILIATARENGLTLVTRDRAILRYADAGHVRALRC